jgi:hypothetical protein
VAVGPNPARSLQRDYRNMFLKQRRQLRSLEVQRMKRSLQQMRWQFAGRLRMRRCTWSRERPCACQSLAASPVMRQDFNLNRIIVLK